MTPRDLSFLRYPGVVVRGEVFESKESAVLLEDLVEVELPSGKFIDLGWYPEHDVNGEYVVRLWSRDDPKSEESFRTPDLDRALRRIERLVVSHRRVENRYDTVQYEAGSGHELISLRAPTGVPGPSTVCTSITANAGERLVLEYA